MAERVDAYHLALIKRIKELVEKSNAGLYRAAELKEGLSMESGSYATITISVEFLEPIKDR